MKKNNRNTAVDQSKYKIKNVFIKHKLIFAVLVLIMFAAFLCACGAGSRSQNIRISAGKAQADGAYNKEAAIDYNVSEEKADRPVTAVETNAAGGCGMGGAAQDGESQSVQNPLPDSSAKKIIKNASLNLETLTFEDTLNKITSETENIGGYIEQSDLYNNSLYPHYYMDSYYDEESADSEARSANITARVPSDKLDDFIAFLEKDTNEVYKSINISNVTLQYMDIESRKKSLEVEQDRLWELMEKAENVDAIVTIEARLSEVRYELENLTSQLKYYDNQVDYSTVTINLAEVKDYRTRTDAGIATRISTGFVKTLKNIKRFFTELLIGFVVSIPVIILIAALAAVIIFIVIKFVKKHKKPKNKEKNVNDEKAMDSKESMDAKEKTEK